MKWQACVFPKRPFPSLRETSGPTPALSPTHTQGACSSLPAEPTPPVRWGEEERRGAQGRAAPTFHSVFLCIQVCRSTWRFPQSQHSRWQNLKKKRTEKSPSRNINPQVLMLIIFCHMKWNWKPRVQVPFMWRKFCPSKLVERIMNDFSWHRANLGE